MTPAPHGEHWDPDPRQLEVFSEVEGGKSQAQVARERGCSKSAINSLIAKIRRWKACQILPTIEALQKRHELLLEQIVEQSLQEWDRSKHNVVTVVERKDAQGNVVTTTTKGQCGDPRYLAEARAALDDIRKIRGANAPFKTEVSGTLDHSLRIVQRDDFYGNTARITVETANALPAEAVVASGETPEQPGPV